MIFRRHWLALVIAGACCVGMQGAAQDETSGGGTSSGGSSSGGGSGATSSFGSGSSSSGTSNGTGFSSPFESGTSGTSGTTSPFGPLFDTSPNATPSSPFSTGPTNTAPPASGAPGASSAFGAGATTPFGQSTAPREAAPSFSIPGSYGQSAQQFTLGEGRLARPRFQYSASQQVGYDDNVLQTPTVGIPAVRAEELVDPGSAPQTIYVPQYETRIVNINGIPTPTQVFVGNVPITKPGRDPQVRQVVVSPAQGPIGSFFTRTSLSAEATLASRKTVFTMDLRGNADFYFSRPKDNNDLTGSLAFSYLHNINPRLQFSASVSLSYLSQPDAGILNGPTRNVGDYFTGSSRFNLSYRWSKRFSTVTSLSLNSILYSVAAQQSGNYYEGILGTEARYAWSRRLTLIGELRYGHVMYPDNELLDSNTAYLLLGAEYILSKQISTSVRVGESFRTFTNSDEGGVSSTPYLEASLSWRYSKIGALNWNTRFGFEEPGSVNTEVLGFRTGLSAVQAFSSRLKGSAGANYVRRTSTFDTTNTDFTEQTIDLSLGLEYTISKRFSVNASYSFTKTFSDNSASDYYRNRVFFGGEYTF